MFQSLTVLMLDSSVLIFCANRMTGRSIDAWNNKRTQEKQTQAKKNNQTTIIMVHICVYTSLSL